MPLTEQTVASASLWIESHEAGIKIDWSLIAHFEPANKFGQLPYSLCVQIGEDKPLFTPLWADNINHALAHVGKVLEKRIYQYFLEEK